MEYSDLILVTWDFTDKSYIALEHAIDIAKNIKHDIAIIHIVKKESEVTDAKNKIAESVKKYFDNISVKPQIFVKEGTIFTTIAEMAEEIKARMVVMPTHGIKGVQKLLGSWALKVIAGSRSPFIVVQDKPKSNIFKNILMPIGFRKENKEIINWATYFAKNFGSKFHLFYGKYTDTNFLKGVESNLLFLNKYFTQKNIHFEAVSASGGGKEFHHEVIEYAAKINADSIMVMTTRDISLADYVLGAQEQYIIANHKEIPVICINPKPAKIGGGFSTSGG